jgi:hypothetical protein
MRKKIISLIMAVTIMATGSCLTAYAAPQNNTQKTSKINHVSSQYIIAQDGTGDFATINEAVAAAQSGDTLIIYPGTYDEVISITGKELNLIGLSKDLCIIKSDGVSYRQSPLSIGAGTVSNLTIYGAYTGSNSARELTAEEIEAYNATLDGGDSWERQQNYRGYAVHIDQNYSYGKSLTFDNCRIISENNHSIGIGTRGGLTININNCEIIATGEGGCLYMHDSPLPDIGGEVHLNVTNSYLTSYLCPYVMTFESILPESTTTYLTFQNVKASTVAYASDESYVSNNVNTFFDVETLDTLNKAGLLQLAGFTTTATNLVTYLDHKETNSYMETIEEALEKGNASKVMSMKLKEGITYIGEAKDYSEAQSLLKHQVIAIFNSDNLSGDGWCGLDSTYLTADSFGNTLVEMNAVNNLPQTP